jgi:hypothetical protein
MVSVSLELETLRARLAARGLEEEDIDSIVRQAEQEIISALRDRLDQALDAAVEAGVEKDSVEFINDLRPREDAFLIDTGSGKLDFSDPPYPMLDNLLSGAKPIKDGSGVYKVIPVGAPSKKSRDPIHLSIFDAQKAMMAERHEAASNRYRNVTPSGSKANFRTATSKQNRNSQWVLPAKEKMFEEDLSGINDDLHSDRDGIILDIINSYAERY